MKGADLKPRAVAVLCALRTGSRSLAALRNIIGDSSTNSTRDLLGCMRDMGLLHRVAINWGLTYDGLGWLQTNGLDADDDAKREMHAVYDAARAVSP